MKTNNPKGAGRKPSPNPLTKKVSLYLLPIEFEVLKSKAGKQSLNSFIRELLAPELKK
jgi:hypothetical protein